LGNDKTEIGKNVLNIINELKVFLEKDGSTEKIIILITVENSVF
jgi:hypothetical protein